MPASIAKEGKTATASFSIVLGSGGEDSSVAIGDLPNNDGF
jgi:hypothetical protein